MIEHMYPEDLIWRAGNFLYCHHFKEIVVSSGGDSQTTVERMAVWGQSSE